uniref:Lectizyme n=1 Tax=Glossina brevipalpis TaxID=37001 RepID=A0A1A9WSD9_9MUSC
MRFLIAIVLTSLLLIVEAKAFKLRPQPRIVLGKNASPGQFPFMVSIRYGDSQMCGGSIISANYIVTAAHCVTTQIDGDNFDTTPSWLSVHAGSVDRENDGVVVQVSEFITYPGYRGLMGDVAVVKLAQPLNFSEHIKPISLAESDPPNFANVEIIGWGRLYQDGPKPEILQYTSLSSLPHSQCKVYNPHGDESLLCLLPQRRTPSGLCNSDSGGPAVYNGRLVGIANYVNGRCGSKNPDVFANIAFYADWIKENSDLNNSESGNSNSLGEAKGYETKLKRMVLGSNARPGQFPYIVSLHRGNRQICGGSIITSNYILTAAHCLQFQIGTISIHIAPHQFSIRAGSISSKRGGITVQVASFTKFPGFRGFSGDIAVIRLAQPLNFTDKIRPIRLSNSDPPNMTVVETAGWGRLYSNGPQSEILQFISMSALSNDWCRILDPRINESFLCLLSKGSNGVCQGDSGGPAVYNDRLVGVANYITGYCGSRHPDMFASVAHYANWIRDNTDLKNSIIK